MTKTKPTTKPIRETRFGAYGGRYVPETLIPALDELDAAYDAASADPTFKRELDDMLANYVGRPSPLYHAERLTEQRGRQRCRAIRSSARGAATSSGPGTTARSHAARARSATAQARSRYGTCRTSSARTGSASRRRRCGASTARRSTTPSPQHTQ